MMLCNVVFARVLPAAMLRATALLALGGAAAFAVAPSAASACLPLAPCAPIEWTVPPSGSVDVPLNVELEGILYGASAWTPAVVVTLRRADTGEDVPLVAARTPGRLRPELPLAPETTYELSAPTNVARVPSSSIPSCDESPVVVASFTTGTAVDTTPPTDVTAAATGCGMSSCDSGSCCGPYVARTAGATWSATDDGALPVAYAFGSPDGPRTLATSGISVTLVSGSGGSPFWMPIPGASPVYAIDAAGNVSFESAPFSFDGLCPPLPSTERERGGCAVTFARASSHALLVALFCAAFLVLRRRQRRSAPRHGV